ncbi:MAG: hypothetical protein ACYC0V_16020, partial [Armatimonadota bacterium]
SDATITNVAIKVTRLGGYTFNDDGMQDWHMFLMKGSTVSDEDKANMYTLPDAYTDFPASPYEWSESWTSVIYGYDADDSSVGTPDWWGFDDALSPSDLPTLGFKLAARGVTADTPAGWGAGAKCFPNDNYLIAIKITYN